jgi:hypothetical protein
VLGGKSDHPKIECTTELYMFTIWKKKNFLLCTQCNRTYSAKDTWYPWFQPSAAMLMKSVVFWVITRRRVVIIYRHFGTTCRSHLHGSRFQVGKKACW